MDLRNISIDELLESYQSHKLTVSQIAQHCLDRIKANKDIHSFISINENLKEQAKVLDEKLQRGEEPGRLFGVPIGLKDNICTKDMNTTCASKMLEHYRPDYNATLVDRLLAEDALLIGKTNLDEFAMGGSSETSYFGPSKNPVNPELVPGGSSSGSATSVATGEVAVAIGTDTGGSVRQPSSYCRVIGFKPSYGLISRYGVVSMSNTLDTVGIIGNRTLDIEKVLSVIGGNDPLDYTSVEEKNWEACEKKSLKGMHFAIPENLENYVAEESLLEEFKESIETIKAEGAIIEEVGIDYLQYALETYQIIMSGEVNSNLARFDGIRYGYRTKEYDTTDDLFVRTRSEGFGPEAKRRIALGAMYLSTTDNQRLYKKAMAVRQQLIQAYKKILEKYDALLTPTTVELPPKFGETEKHAMNMYSSDTFNTPVNLAGLCAITLPLSKEIGGSLQLIGPRNEDSRLLSIAKGVERKVCHGC